MATAAVLQHSDSALPRARDRDRSTSRSGRAGPPAHRNAQPTLRTINEIVQALRERPLVELNRTCDGAPAPPLLYLPPILSLLPPSLSDDSSFPSTSAKPVQYTHSRLPAIDPVTLAFHRALRAFRPVTPLYAVVPYAEAFNWSEIALEYADEGTVRDAEREWYVVAFRSRRRRGLSEKEAEKLYRADREAHEEAVARNILMYWFGAPFPSQSERGGAPIDDDLVGVNLATCIWNSRRDAVEAMRGDKHRQAAKLASTTYETYQLERYVVRKEKGELGVSIRAWHGGEVVGAS